MCVFAHHNLLKDPPFSRIDLLSCRNVVFDVRFHGPQLYIIARSKNMTWRARAETHFKELQDRITRAIEELDGETFREDVWAREGGGGGHGTRIRPR